MIQQVELHITPKDRGFHLITDEVLSKLVTLPNMGLLNIFCQHTSCAITINENYDPSVRLDLENSFNHLIKENESFYTHTIEGPDDMPAHIKSSLLGASLSIPITNFKLNLGQWQGLYLCEFRNHPTPRKIILTVYH